MSKKRTMRSKDPNSKRSKRRVNRGFQSLEQSSRKHKRARRRLEVAKIAKPNPQSEHQQHIGGSVNYH